MSIEKNDLRLSGSAVQSGARLTNSRVNHRVCATFLAGLILFSAGGAKASTSPNVLVNPGAETGDLTGWNRSLTGYIYVVSTNGTMMYVTNSPVSTNKYLAHSGKYTFQLFDTTASSAFIYQDIAAVSNSVWAASCWTICYASNYFNPGASAHMQVVFYDVSNNVVVSPSSSSGTAGVYGSDFLDPSGPPDPSATWIFAPPAAVDTNGWVFLQPTNLYAPGPPPLPADLATESYWETSSNSFATNLTAPPGTAFVRYTLRFDNSTTDGGDVYWDDCVLQKVVGSDPDIDTPPTSVTTYKGLPASFTVGAWRVKPEVLTYQWQKNGTNLPAAGGVNDIQGDTISATLSMTNCQPDDAGQFTVVVSDANGWISSVPVTLTVLALSPLQKVNVLGANAGFENNPNWDPWEYFNGCYFAIAADFYPGSTTNVNVYDGNSVALIGDNGDRDNGFHHAFGTGGGNCTFVAAVAPGTVWKAGGWAYISSADDFIAGNTCRLQIWFRDVNGASLSGATPTYESFKIYGLAYTNVDMQYTNIDVSSTNYGQVGYHAQLPRDQWCFLTVSNMVNNNGWGLDADLPTNTVPGVFMVPRNTNVAQINFQVFEYCPQSSDVGRAGDYLGNGADSVYWDDMQLIQVVPVTNLTASVSGNNMNLSFSAQAGLNYAVLYKTNLTDATWSLLADVSAPWIWQTNILSTGTSTNVTVTDPVGAKSRFYRLQVH